ncbi:ParB family protein [Rhodococcus olei]
MAHLMAWIVEEVGATVNTDKMPNLGRRRPGMMAEVTRPEHPVPAGSDFGRGRTRTKQTNVPLPVDLRARMEAAAVHTLPHEGLNSMTRFIAVAAEELCERLEREYNGGRRFDPPTLPSWVPGAPATRSD